MLAPLLIALLLALAPAQAQPRYHAILMAHDDLPWETDAQGVAIPGPDGGRRYFYPRPGEPRSMVREQAPVHAPAEEPADGCAKRTPHTLCFVQRDQQRFEEFMLLFAEPEWVSRLDVRHEGAPLPATERSGRVLASTIEQTEGAFADTRCRIRHLKGLEPEGCEGFTPDARAAERVDPEVEDIVFVHFSGHGLPDGLVLRNGGVPPATMEGWLRSLGADLVVVIIDACHGAGLTGGGLNLGDADDEVRVFKSPLFQRGPLDAPRGIALFNAAVHYQLIELQALRSGALTHLMLSGLMGGADDDRDRRITFAELSEFFYANTTRAGEFDGRAAAPGGNRERVLLNLEDARRATHVLEVSRRLGGRLLLTDGVGAVAELNVEGRALHVAPTVELHLPRPAYDLYFLDTKSNPVPEVRRVPRWDLTRESRHIRALEGTPPPAGDRFAAYLADSHLERRMFSSRAYPVQEWRPGLQLSVTGFTGYHCSQVFGATSEADVNALEADPGYALWSEERVADHLELLQEASPGSWNLLNLGGVVRAHGLWFGMAELRGDLSLAPRTAVHLAEGSSVFVASAGGGLGLSSYLFSPALLGAASVGKRLVLAHAPYANQGLGEAQFPSWSRSSRENLYLSVSLRMDLAQLRPIVFEVTRLWESQELTPPPPAGDRPRAYDAVQVRVGFELGRRAG